MEARIGCLQRATDDLCDLAHRQLFEFVQHEYLAFALIELSQHLLQPRARSAEFERALLLRRGTRFGRRFADLLVPPVRALAIVRSDAHADAVAPGAQRATVIVFESPVNDEKYLLANIGNVRACHAEPAQHAPDERARVGKNTVEIELGVEQDRGVKRSRGVLEGRVQSYQSELQNHTEVEAQANGRH